jgi:hypothetical protein
VQKGIKVLTVGQISPYKSINKKKNSGICDGFRNLTCGLTDKYDLRIVRLLYRFVQNHQTTQNNVLYKTVFAHFEACRFKGCSTVTRKSLLRWWKEPG